MTRFVKGAFTNSSAEDSQKRLRKIRNKAQGLLDEIENSPSGFIQNHDLGILCTELSDSIKELSHELGED